MLYIDSIGSADLGHTMTTATAAPAYLPLASLLRRSDLARALPASADTLLTTPSVPCRFASTCRLALTCGERTCEPSP